MNHRARTFTYQPSAFYYRKRLRGTDNPVTLRRVGLHVVREYEQLREWVREQGMIPPKWSVDPEEAQVKGWDQRSG